MMKSSSTRLVVGLIIVSVWTVPVASSVIIVSPESLSAAFKSSKSGDTLKLIGTFGATKLSNQNFSKLVTLDATKATFTGTLQLSNVTNVKLSGGIFSLAGDGLYTKAALVNGGSNIWFDRTIFAGDAGEYGVWFNGTSGAKVSGGQFTGLRSGIVFSSVTNGLATKNKITAAASDGIDIANSHEVVASYNSCSATNPGPGVHADCIQLWSIAGNPLQSDITVNRNTATGQTQGFTSFQNGGGGLRIHITNNIVHTSYSQGIACYDCIDSDISNNHVSTIPGSAHKTNLSVLGGSNNTVMGNIVDPFTPVQMPVGHSAALGNLSQYPNGIDDSVSGSQLALFTERDATIPEPSTWAMLLIGFAATALAGRRHARSTRLRTH